MGLSPFKSCSTNYKVNAGPAPNPNSSRWELVDYIEFTNAYVLKVHYLDCTNFEGIKIMVYAGKLRHQKELDPHFSENSDSPIARFRPDDNGWKRAISLAESL